MTRAPNAGPGDPARSMSGPTPSSRSPSPTAVARSLPSGTRPHRGSTSVPARRSRAGWLSMSGAPRCSRTACCAPTLPGRLRTAGRGWHRCRPGRRARCRDPQFAETRIVQMARAGRESDLRAALADATAVLATRNSSTDPAFASLAVRAAQLEGRLTRLTDPAHRRARYATAKRPPRATRFLRAAPHLLG